ncbi:MAG TPA: hypothetical protein V6D29_03640 [Leptolyngbyaceae cyanobacterium]
MDKNATGKIARWEKETEYSEEELEVLMGAVDGSPSYRLTFLVDTDKVILIASKPFNYIFQGFFKGQEASNLIHLESMAVLLNASMNAHSGRSRSASTSPTLLLWEKGAKCLVPSPFGRGLG